jgi:hypothetical protein
LWTGDEVLEERLLHSPIDPLKIFDDFWWSGVRRLAGELPGASSCSPLSDASPLFHRPADLPFEFIRFYFKFFQFTQQFLAHRFILKRI